MFIYHFLSNANSFLSVLIAIFLAFLDAIKYSNNKSTKMFKNSVQIDCCPRVKNTASIIRCYGTLAESISIVFNS